MNKKEWIKAAIVIVYVLSVTYMVGKWAIHYAYLERGYDAVGGEYILIPTVAMAAYEAISIFLDVLEDSGYVVRGYKKRCGGTTGMRDNK